MSFGKGGDAPAVPDFTSAAQQQYKYNKKAGEAQAQLNNPNVVNPYGTQNVTWEKDPETGNMSPTVTQQFSPEQQQLYNQQTEIQKMLGQLGIQGADQLGSVIGQNLDLSGAPAAPGDSQATRDSVYNAMMSRVNEDYGNQTDQKNSDLIAAGIHPGTKAYDDSMQLLQRGKNDAMQQAITGAGQEAQRDFTMDTQARQNYIAELLSQRQTPLNEINALMSGSQVSNPFAVPNFNSGTSIQPAPYMDATMAQYTGNLGAYNANQAAGNNALSGLFGIGSSVAGALPWGSWFA